MSKKIKKNLSEKSQPEVQLELADTMCEWAFQNKIPIEKIQNNTDLVVVILAQLHCLRKGFSAPYNTPELMRIKK